MDKLINLLKEKGVVQYGDFELSSGQYSDYKIVLDDAVKDPEILDMVTDLMLPHIPKVQVIVGQINNGDIIAKSLAKKMNVKYGNFRKDPPGLRIDGCPVGVTFYSIDDVSTTDDSIDFQEYCIQKFGGRTIGAMVVVARNPETTKKGYLLPAEKLL
jgi:orotate phosphoribosyltransferase